MLFGFNLSITNILTSETASNVLNFASKVVATVTSVGTMVTKFAFEVGTSLISKASEAWEHYKNVQLREALDLLQEGNWENWDDLTEKQAELVIKTLGENFEDAVFDLLG